MGTLLAAVLVLSATGAMAQAVSGTAEVDLTPVIVAVVGGVFTVATTVIGAWVTAFITSRMKDRDAAVAVSNAVKNALGKIQQAAQPVVEAEAARLDPKLRVPEYLAPGVQYVLDHAGEEAARFGMTPQAIADKIVAQLGLKNIEANMAVNASSIPVVVPPLAQPRDGVLRAISIEPVATAGVAEPAPVLPGSTQEHPSSEGGDASRPS